MNHDYLRFRENHRVPVVVNITVGNIEKLFDLCREVNVVFTGMIALTVKIHMRLKNLKRQSERIDEMVAKMKETNDHD